MHLRLRTPSESRSIAGGTAPLLLLLLQLLLPLVETTAMQTTAEAWERGAMNMPLKPTAQQQEAAIPMAILP